MTTISGRTIAKAAVGAALFLASAGTAPADAQRHGAPFTWTGSVTPGATVEVKGVNGSVRAVAATGSQVRVDAARTGRRSDPEAVQIVVVEHAGGVTVCAVHPSTAAGRNECLPGDAGRISSGRSDVGVSFTVEVPVGVGFVARTSNGGITAEGMTADVDARSTNGNIRILGARTVSARTTNGSVNVRSERLSSVATTNGRITAHVDSVDPRAPMSLTTSNGTITLTLPGSASAAVDARTSNGRISSEIPLTIAGTSRRDRLTGRIGAGAGEIRLRTTNGGITLQPG
jgi:hypothetical protein